MRWTMRARASLHCRLPLVLLLALVAVLAAPAAGASAAATADLGITMTAGPKVVPPGGTTTFTVVVTNDGPGTASGITVSAPFGIAWNGITCVADHGGVCQRY